MTTESDLDFATTMQPVVESTRFTVPELQVLTEAAGGDAEQLQRLGLATTSDTVGLVTAGLPSLAASDRVAVVDGGVVVRPLAAAVGACLATAQVVVTVELSTPTEVDRFHFVLGEDDWRLSLRVRAFDVVEATVLVPDADLATVTSELLRAWLGAARECGALVECRRLSKSHGDGLAVLSEGDAASVQVRMLGPGAHEVTRASLEELIARAASLVRAAVSEPVDLGGSGEYRPPN